MATYNQYDAYINNSTSYIVYPPATEFTYSGPFEILSSAPSSSNHTFTMTGPSGAVTFTYLGGADIASGTHKGELAGFFAESGGNQYFFDLSGATPPPDAGEVLTFNGEQGVSLQCFAAGTQIRTAAGDVPIERLVIGDRVLTASGALREVRWLGHRTIDCSKYRDSSVVWPVCVRAGALAESVPSRDLWVSPGHSFYIDGVLVQACNLVNGVTIVQVPRNKIEYWHLELDSHDIVIAENAPAESYLDTGNRTGFINGGPFLETHPDFLPKHWTDTCVPLILEGAELTAIRAKVLNRVQALGYEIHDDADLHVFASGTRIDPIRLSANRVAFALPSVEGMELRCNTFVPAHVNADSRDQRVLGICIDRWQLNGEDLPLSDEAKFSDGWHGLEGEGKDMRRWTGAAVPLPTDARLLVLDLAGRGYYRARVNQPALADCA